MMDRTATRAARDDKACLRTRSVVTASKRCVYGCSMFTSSRWFFTMALSLASLCACGTSSSQDSGAGDAANTANDAASVADVVADGAALDPAVAALCPASAPCINDGPRYPTASGYSECVQEAQMNASMGCYQTAVQMAMCQNANVVCGANGMSDELVVVHRKLIATRFALRKHKPNEGSRSQAVGRQWMSRRAPGKQPA
jgi:hypothetical protein